MSNIQPLHEQSDPSSLIWKPGQILLDEFLVESIAGLGGLGIVYCVRRLSDRKRFAMKTLLKSPREHPETARIFFRELRTWIDLPDHPNIVKCCFFRTIDDRLAIFSEYIGAGSLKQWIREKRIVSAETILDLAIQIARGLHGAHIGGLIHQDIKPSNILMTHDGTAKLTDFGLAQARTAIVSDLAESRHATELFPTTGMSMPYCSPEQAMIGNISRKTDIWSFGVTILEMFIGDVTWPVGSLAGYVLSSFLKEAPDSTTLKPTRDVVRILKRCFRSDPAQRWRDAGELAQRLEQAFKQLTGRSYHTHRPPPAPPPASHFHSTQPPNGYRHGMAGSSDLETTPRIVWQGNRDSNNFTVKNRIPPSATHRGHRDSR